MTGFGSYRSLKIVLLMCLLYCAVQIKLLRNGALPLHQTGKRSSDGKHYLSDETRPPEVKTTDKMAIFKERRHLLETTCQALAPKQTYDSLCGHVVHNPKLSLSWCYVPKTGCTFWKKVFLVLQNTFYGDKSLTLSGIGFRQVHTAPLQNMCEYHNTEAVANNMSQQDTLIFVRNPYSRLFSAYIDKLFLSDHWSSVGTHIVSRYRNEPSTVSKRCGHDVSFREFIDYVIHVGETGGGVEWFRDDHWLPISKVCLPCLLPFKYIAKQETFASDRDFLLEQLGLQQYFNESFSKYNNSVRTISERIEAFWVTGLRSGCVSENEMMRRFWTSFQLQGYLPYNETLQSNLKGIKKPITVNKFKRLVLKVYTQYKNEDLKHQKIQGMTKGYTFLTLSHMRKLQQIYHLDFALFGYDHEPTELFSYFIPEVE